MLRQAAWNEGGLCAFSILSLAQEKQTSPLSFVQHKQTHSEESGGGPGSLHMSPKPRIRRIRREEETARVCYNFSACE